MSYAVSDHPLGPYKKGGVIIDNTGCDPQSWNNHGSIEYFKGQWYLFYHRSSQNSHISRRVCAEPIYFDENGCIQEVPQTCNGPEKPLDAKLNVDASIASRMSHGCYISPIENGEAVFYRSNYEREEWIEYRVLDFGDGVSELVLRIKGKGTVSVRCESMLLGSMEYNCDNFTNIKLPVSSVSGPHILWILLKGEDTVLDSFYFK